MMDITAVFKASVKTIRTRNKALGINRSSEDANRIMNPRPGETKFQTRAKEIIASITKLKDFLQENKNAYLDTSAYLFSQGPKLSKAEREEIDAAAQLIIKNSTQLMQELKKDSSLSAANPQTIEHRQAVLAAIENYLKSVCRLYSEQKQLLAKRESELEKITKLEPDPFSSIKRSSSLNNSNQNIGETLAETLRVNIPYNEDLEKAEQETNFTLEEVQMFEKENVHLFNELNSLNEEVKKIQGRVVKIAELQQTFTEKIMEQEKDIERIATTSVGATENIREGNEQLRQAMQSNSGFRVAIMFFLLVLSFSLLFLDWYNE